MQPHVHLGPEDLVVRRPGARGASPDGGDRVRRARACRSSGSRRERRAAPTAGTGRRSGSCVRDPCEPAPSTTRCASRREPCGGRAGRVGPRRRRRASARAGPVPVGRPPRCSPARRYSSPCPPRPQEGLVLLTLHRGPRTTDAGVARTRPARGTVPRRRSPALPRRRDRAGSVRRRRPSRRRSRSDHRRPACGDQGLSGRMGGRHLDPGGAVRDDRCAQGRSGRRNDPGLRDHDVPVGGLHRRLPQAARGVRRRHRDRPRPT